MNRHALALLVLPMLSGPVAAHHTKEHLLQPPTHSSPASVRKNVAASDDFWYALGPFFLLAAIGLVRWKLKDRDAPHARTERKD